MAKQQTLKAQIRSGVGRSAVNKIKTKGLVPAVIYGGKEEPQSLQLNGREIARLLAHASSEHVLVDLEIEGNGAKTNRLALIQEVQHHPLRRDIVHVDFHAVRADELIHAEIPVEPFGEPSGVKNFGGILEIGLHAVEVECFPKDLPEVIRIDVTALNVGDAIHIKDLQLPEGVKVRGDGDLSVLRVAAPTVEVEPVPGAEGAAAAEPEVIKEKKVEEAPAAAGDKKGEKK